MNRRLIPFLFLFLPLTSQAVSSIDIHIGELQYQTVKVQNISATLTMDGQWSGKGTVKTDLAGLEKITPLPVKVSKGSLQGNAQFSGNQTILQKVKAELNASDVAFSDADGLHAGDKLKATLVVNAERILENTAQSWNWSGSLGWPQGEAFWQPIYLSDPGLQLSASGLWQPDMLTVKSAAFSLADIGQIDFDGQIHLPDKTVQTLNVSGKKLQLGKGYTVLFKPFFDKGELGDLDVAGQADIKGSMADGHVQNFRLNLTDVDLADKKDKFAFYKVNADIPWSYDDKTHAVVKYDGGHMLGVTLGAANHEVDLERYSLVAPHLKLPLLDGAILVDDLAASLINDQWNWRMHADTQGITMPEFTHAFGWPRMEGKIEAHIPQVLYYGGKLTADGAINLGLFGGTVSLDKLSIIDPIGVAPRMSADVTMRNMDMGLLTSTFSLGAMQGKMDGDITDMELSNWKPVNMNAHFYSSPGSYPKKISQRAVENISALGGAGAAAAVQRSFLRFFKEFNYQTIGWSCILSNGICKMAGAESTPQGYIIVKGSGIPSITVMGYNQSVSWDVLVQRVQRIIQGNVKPIIK
ncbi:MAG TPA: hypothetical protein VIE17_06630 [Methylophilaceae bacterium]|jgi:hypothetical protein